MDFYLILVIILFILAATDLMVGVSNDAVNFLNSAIGSKVAPRRIIMIVASLGIFLGATFSSGMMEVARKGIFNPGEFFFQEIMIIFLAVMITDIILLDLFNTFGLPTSTTVSIVFELLGAAVMVSIIKLVGADQGIQHLGDYINSDKALQIISGILLSVVFAFSIGMLIMWLSRLLFSFQYEKRLKYAGAIWGGLAVSAISYFLIIKGLKGASFVSKDTLAWVKDHTILLVAISFAFWALVLQAVTIIFKVNVLKFIVLLGTFALAMAFAGNDLVNFIGVPIAGFQSYNAWSESGMEAGDFGMGMLAEKQPTETYLLLIAGGIMVLTLWISKKARTVTETEVNLGRQDEGSERFSPNSISRGIVRGAQVLGNGLQMLVPARTRVKMEKNFEKVSHKAEIGKEYNPPAFDLVRASVNLTVASILISIATSLKLPLSTTYVSFMVAMGASLADKAWGRDSAVFRVAGVLNVIGGWFFTALIAFSAAATFALILWSFEGVGVAILLSLAVGLIVRSNIVHRRREKAKEASRAFERNRDAIPASQVATDTATKVAESLRIIKKAYDESIEGLTREDRSLLREARKDMEALQQQNDDFRVQLMTLIQRIQEEEGEGSKLYIMVYDLEQDIVQSIGLIVEKCYNHVENVHNPLKVEQANVLLAIRKAVGEYLDHVINVIESQDFKQIEQLLAEKHALLAQLEDALEHQVSGIKDDEYGGRNSLLYFSIVLETKDMTAVAARFVKLYDRQD